MNSLLYAELKKNVEEAQAEGKHGIMIANSETMSADQIHKWFPNMEVKWDTENHIHIRWA
jgi:hypothetical protein